MANSKNNKDVGAIGFILVLATTVFFCVIGGSPRGDIAPLLKIANLLAFVVGIILCIVGVVRRPRSKLAIAGLAFVGLFIIFILFALRHFF